MTEYLCQYFLSKHVTSASIPKLKKPNNVIDELDKAIGRGKWAWEPITTDKDTVVVAVYVPGAIYTGVCSKSSVDAKQIYNVAICNAVRKMMSDKPNEAAEPEQTKQMNAQEVQGMLNTKEEVEEYAEKHDDSVPFDMISTNAVNEMMDEMAKPEQVHSTDDIPLDKYNGMSKNQFKCLKQFRKDAGITNEKELRGWLSRYGKYSSIYITSSKEFTGNNIDGFLKWANGFKENDV